MALNKKELPKAKINIYGAYATQKIEQLHNESQGFLIKGWADHAEKVMREARVCLAPLRFGAGLKGKFILAMQCGTPSVTTAIGLEGLTTAHLFNGLIADDPESLAQAAIKLYSDKTLWENAQEKGFDIINTEFQATAFKTPFLEILKTLSDNLKQHREANFIGAMLQHHSLQSSKYLAKWIEAKNKI